MQKESDSNVMFEIEMPVKALKKLIDGIHPVIPKMNINVNAEQMSINTIDSSNFMYLLASVKKENAISYKFNASSPLQFGIQNKVVLNVLKSFKSTNFVMKYLRDKNIIRLLSESDEYTDSVDIAVIDVESNTLDDININYAVSIKMEGHIIKTLVNDAGNIGSILVMMKQKNMDPVFDFSEERSNNSLIHNYKRTIRDNSKSIVTNVSDSDTILRPTKKARVSVTENESVNEHEDIIIAPHKVSHIQYIIKPLSNKNHISICLGGYTDDNNKFKVTKFQYNIECMDLTFYIAENIIDE